MTIYVHIQPDPKKLPAGHTKSVFNLFRARIEHATCNAAVHRLNYCGFLIFWASGENRQYDESCPRCAQRERTTVSDFYCLKTLAAPFSPSSIASGTRSTVCSLNGSRNPGRQLAQYRAPPVLPLQFSLFERGRVLFRSYAVPGSLA